MLNDQYEPASQNEEAILNVLCEGGRFRAKDIAEQTGKSMQNNNQYLRRLVASGWVVEEFDGLYELRCDPRELSREERIELFREYAADLARQVHAESQGSE